MVLCSTDANALRLTEKLYSLQTKKTWQVLLKCHGAVLFN